MAASLVLCVPLSRAEEGSGESALEQFERKLLECPAEDISQRLELAGWAMEHALPQRAEKLYRQILAKEPEHEEARRGLEEAAKRFPLASASPAYEAARKILPGDFAEYETNRFVILSNASSRWTREQGGRLEEACHQFHRFARRLGISPLPLKHKLVCVLFQDREEFAAFGSDSDQMNDSWSLGYFSPRNDRIVFFNGEAEEDADEFAAKRSVATTIHEAIHQLSFHTQIQTPYVQYPLWINEGLATSFETDRPNEAFGPDHEFEPRRRRFEKILKEDRLIPLRKLVTCDTMPGGRMETIAAVYSQSYALLTWLSKNRGEELREYLVLMMRQPPGRPDAERHLQLFELAFGDVDRLEKAWLRDESRRIADGVGTRDLLALSSEAAVTGSARSSGMMECSP